jgi:uncharacterized protein involved in propanediol utilization
VPVLLNRYHTCAELLGNPPQIIEAGSLADVIGLADLQAGQFQRSVPPTEAFGQCLRIEPSERVILITPHILLAERACDALQILQKHLVALPSVVRS